jgi:outer membrane protein assembly factor BamB
MKRVLALTVLGMAWGGCGGGSDQASPPTGAGETRRAALAEYIKTSTPWKFVAWESMLRGVEVTRVSLREDSLFVETVDTTNARNREGMPSIYRIDAKTGAVAWIVDLPAPADFPPAVVPSIVRQLEALTAEQQKLVRDREVERTRKEKNVEKINQLTDEIRRRSELLNSTRLQDRVYAVSRHDFLHVIERPAGAEFDRERLAFTPSTAAGANASVVFIGALDRDRVIGLDPNTWAEIIYFAAEGEIRTTPIVAEPNNVYFASTDGHIYGYTANDGRKLIDYKTEDAIVSDLCLDIETSADGRETYGALLAGSTDYSLYCLNRVSGDLMWKYETGGKIMNAPQTSGGVAYCFAREKGFHAIDKRTGKLLYQKGTDVYYIICRGKDRVYAYGKGGAILALEERTGRELARYDAGDFKWVQENARSRMTFLVTKDGCCFAVKESEIDY